LNDVDDDDQDGVPNKWDAHPLGGDPMLNRIFYLPNQSLQLQLPYDYYHYQIINKPRTFTHEFGNLTDFVTPTETLIDYIVGRQLQNEGLTELDHIQYFVTLAQSIDYLGDEETSFLEYPKYPVETLIDGVGDCEDSSFVLASLLLAYQQKTGADFKVVLLRYPKHLAVGLGLKEPLLNTVPALTENGYNYYHLETTNDKWSFGEQPTHLEKEEIIVKGYYNIGFATDTPNGLMVPIIKNVDRKNIWELSSEIQDLAQRARTGKLKLDEVTGGTFTLTNVGPIGGLMSTPIINYPEIAIIGIHQGKLRPVVIEDNGRPEIAIRKMMYLSISVDHRATDGANAARFLNAVIRYLESPALMVLDQI